MKLFGVLLLVAFASGAPTSKEDDKLVVTEEFFPDQLAVYTSQYDIVSIFVPLNALNFGEDSEDDDTDNDDGTLLFFVEADVKETETDYKGLYVLKNGTATKLLDNGRDSAATHDESKVAYFAAKDGIYKYNADTNSAEKYGTVTDSIINIEVENGTDLTVIYVLTENKVLYKVTEDGNKKVRIGDVNNADQIVLDYSNNLYYLENKQPYVINLNGIKKFEGLPANPSTVTLLRPPFVIDDGVPFISDNNAYILYANGTVENSSFDLQVRPTAYSMEATLIQYYGYNKKIYEYNILALVLTNILEELKEFLNENKDSITAIRTRSRNELHANL